MTKFLENGTNLLKKAFNTYRSFLVFRINIFWVFAITAPHSQLSGPITYSPHHGKYAIIGGGGYNVRHFLQAKN